MTSWDHCTHQELAEDIKDIKTALDEIKTLFLQHFSQLPRQPTCSSLQPPFLHFPRTPHFQQPTQPCPTGPTEPAWYTEEYTPPPCPVPLPCPVETVPAQFSASFLMDLKSQSCSRANFASKLARTQFTEEERKNSNVKGVLGKKKLDQKKMIQIKEAVFQIYPCESGESQHSAWITCCKAVDESCRRLNRVKTKENH